MPTFVPPARDSSVWSNGNRQLWLQVGNIPSGMTIYKDGDGWHIVNDYYDESILDESLRFYRGGREYELTLSEYLDVTTWLGTLGYSYPSAESIFEGFYPGLESYPGPESYLGEAT